MILSMLGVFLKFTVALLMISKMVLTASLLFFKNEVLAAITKQGHGDGQFPMFLKIPLSHFSKALEVIL